MKTTNSVNNESEYEGQGHFLTLFFFRFSAYTRPRYQVSVYRTLVLFYLFIYLFFFLVGEEYTDFLIRGGGGDFFLGGGGG